jgi:hypothetical protein
VNTLAFRLVDGDGRHCSNVVWVDPRGLRSWTVDDIRRAVDQSNGP